jgi:hypothetical protein
VKRPEPLPSVASSGSGSGPAEKTSASSSGSAATSCSVSELPSATVRSPIGASTGGRLSGTTVTVTVAAGDTLPAKSATVAVKVRSPCGSSAAGVHRAPPAVAAQDAASGAPFAAIARVAGSTPWPTSTKTTSRVASGKILSPSAGLTQATSGATRSV